MLLDFGLSMHFQHRMTTPGTVLGTIDFMAPEQARDASAVDIRADIYGLGGTLYFALTGRLPFSQVGNPVEALARRLMSEAPSLLPFLPNCPPELDRVVAKMMAREPADRYPTPQAVMQALLGFIRLDSPEHQQLTSPALIARSASRIGGSSRSSRVLVVDDEDGIREFACHVLEMLDLQCDVAPSGAEALLRAEKTPYDLILLDMCMPGMSGREVLTQLRANGRQPTLKVILLSGQVTADEMTPLLQEGADDFLSKPFSLIQFQGRVRAALRLKAAQDRSVHLNEELLTTNAQLEQNLQNRNLDLGMTRRALVMGLSHLVELRDGRSTRHLTRMQRYCRTLAEAASDLPTFKGQIDGDFVNALECCVPLHDVGKVGLPDYILMKTGTLSPEERISMQTHTTFAAETLHGVVRDYPGAGKFFGLAIDVIRHHHERFDGTGYPDKLAGGVIPLGARVVAICDVYDALRRRKPYKPSLSHRVALGIIVDASPGQFDPELIGVFRKVAKEFETIFIEEAD